MWMHTSQVNMIVITKKKIQLWSVHLFSLKYVKCLCGESTVVITIGFVNEKFISHLLIYVFGYGRQILQALNVNKTICKMYVDTNYIFCLEYCPLQHTLSLLYDVVLALIPAASMIYSYSSLHLVLFVLLVLEEEIYIYGQVSVAHGYFNKCINNSHMTRIISRSYLANGMLN